MANTYQLITSSTLSSNTASVTFSNISGNYTDLVLKVIVRETNSSGPFGLTYTLNSNADAVYSQTFIRGSGSATLSSRNANKTFTFDSAVIPDSGYTSNTFGSVEIYIPLYLSSQSKPIGSFGVSETNAATAYTTVTGSLFRSTNFVNSITLTTDAGSPSFASGSSFYLYGISRIGASSVPNAPTIGTATAGGEEASVTFTPSGSGSTADSFAITSNPGSIIGRGLSSPIIVKGLTGGTAYTFTATAVNNVGDSAASSATGSVTPSTKAVYFSGGVAGGTNSAAIDKLPFGTETRTTLSATLSVAKYAMASFANSGTAGYGFSGDTGDGSTQVVATEKLTYSTDVASSFGAFGTTMCRSAAGMANSGTAGYAGGGGNASTGDGLNTIQKLLFSNESRSALAATMRNGNNFDPMGYANSGTAGYFIGGNSGSTYYNNYQKITFSDDSSSNLGTTLTTSTSSAGSFANSGTAGYVLGGSTPTRTDVIVKMPFSTETSASIAATLAAANTRNNGAANSGVAGYVAGGFTSANYIDTIQKLAFSTDTRTSLSATLGSAKDNVGAHANSGTL